MTDKQADAIKTMDGAKLMELYDSYFARVLNTCSEHDDWAELYTALRAEILKRLKGE